MDTVFQCLFCLDRRGKGGNANIQERNDYQDIIECSKGHLKNQIKRDFSLGSSSLSLCTECFECSEKIYNINNQLNEIQEKLKSLVKEFVAKIDLRVSQKTDTADETCSLEGGVKVEADDDLNIKDETISMVGDEYEEPNMDSENESYPVFHSDSESDLDKENPLACGTAHERLQFDKSGKLVNSNDKGATNSPLLTKREATISSKIQSVTSECTYLSEVSPSVSSAVVEFDDDEKPNEVFENEPIFRSDNESDKEDPLACATTGEDLEVGNEDDGPMDQEDSDISNDDYEPQIRFPRVVLPRLQFDKNGKLVNPKSKGTMSSPLILRRRKAVNVCSAKTQNVTSECTSAAVEKHMNPKNKGTINSPLTLRGQKAVNVTSGKTLTVRSECTSAAVERNTTTVLPYPNVLYVNPGNVITLPVVFQEVASLTCNICRCQFSSLESLVIHKQTHIVNVVISSPPGPQQSINIGTFPYGITDTNSDDCGICGKPGILSTYGRHKRSHCGEHEKRHKCATCGKGFHERARMLQHFDVHSSEKSYECKICGLFFKTIPNYRSHVSMHKKGFSCHQCKRIYRTEEALIRHQSVHKPLQRKVFRCDQCGKEFASGGALRQHSLRHNPGEFKCDICGKIFSTKINFNAHIRLHTQEKKHQCEICGQKCRTTVVLKKHIEMVHQKIRKHKCPTCEKAFGCPRNLKRHEQIHKTYLERKKYNCNICSDVFQDATVLLTHKALFHTAYTSGFIYCDKCQCKFLNGYEMSKHYRKNQGGYVNELGVRGPRCSHCKEIFWTRCDLIVHLANVHPPENIPYQCETCGAVFCSPIALKEHGPNCEVSLSYPKGLENSESAQKLGSTKSRKTKSKVVKELLHCSNCEESFTTKRNLRKHELTHQEIHYICQICKVEFPSADELKEHKLKNHVDGNRFKCDFCEKTYTSSKNVEIHRRKHTGQKPFMCQTCGEAFISERYLIDHELRHLESSPHICHICGKAFTKKGNLGTHLKYHEILEGQEKPFSCSFCKKSFSLKANLLRHENLHTGNKSYLCNTCGKSFSQSTTLKTHERIHSGEKPYSCSICGKAFSDHSTWSKHKKTHNS